MKVGEPKERYDAASKKIIIIAGPNGAGKTSFADEFLRQEAGCFTFINADNIAAGLSPYDPDSVAMKAGRIMLQEIERHLAGSHSFAFETTLSGLRYSRLIPVWREMGYGVKMVFLNLPSPDLAVSRVACRVEQGGHNIPEETIQRRYDSGRRNFEEIYKSIVDVWMFYDNSGDKPVLLEEGES